MAKQLNVDMRFRADTSDAERSIQRLQNSLSQISSAPISKGISKEIDLAVSSAKSLERHLSAAINQETGQLDLSKFNLSLSQSNQNLRTLTSGLLRAGIQGEKAFMSLKSSIVSANTALIKGKSLLGDFTTTLANTVRWQFSSSILHSFMSTFQSAYRYAQDLNKSLTGIQIVSGQSATQMAEFADSANKAAKSLSTTTTAYTDAALIFYQQGLKGQEVLDRTDITMKMSNVTGDSADEVSSYMTAIWNNFNKAGDESLEHYGDVLTALGAATASSTAELAGGLEKFASVADTIGLSYEYAASALSTIVATTRQSEDVVGTALKTIFSRLQGLKQGETAEDGTDLNKYSTGLKKVGIEIKDANGNLKDMDQILSEIGERWTQVGENALKQDEKVALAQTVAGVRQYNQFMALFDNWEFMKENLNTAQMSDGELQKQQDIYAKSWEAARDRVIASWQEIYAAVFDDQAFIKMTDILAEVISQIGSVVEGMGGLKGMLELVAGIALSKFAANINKGVEGATARVNLFKASMADSLQALRKNANEATTFSERLKSLPIQAKEFNQGLKRGRTAFVKGFDTNLMLRQMDEGAQEYKSSSRATDAMSDAFKDYNKNMDRIVKQSTDLLVNRKLLTSEERQSAQTQIEKNQLLAEELSLKKQELDLVVAEKDSSLQTIEYRYGENLNKTLTEKQKIQIKNIELNKEDIDILKEELGILKDIAIKEEEITEKRKGKKSKKSQTVVTGTKNVLNTEDTSMSGLLSGLSSVEALKARIVKLSASDLGNNTKTIDLYQKELNQLLEMFGVSKNSVKLDSLKGKSLAEVQAILSQNEEKLLQILKSTGATNNEIEQALNQGKKIEALFDKVNQDSKKLNGELEKVTALIKQAQKRAGSFTNVMSQTVSAVSQMAMGLQMVQSAWETLQDPDATFIDKLVQGTMALSFMSMGLKQAGAALSAWWTSGTIAADEVREKLEAAAANEGKALSEKKDAKNTGESAVANTAAGKSADYEEKEKRQTTAQNIKKGESEQFDAKTSEQSAKSSIISGKAAKEEAKAKRAVGRAAWATRLQMLALMAAIAALVAMFVWMYKQAHKNRKALEDYKNGLDDVSTAMDALKEKTKSLSSTWDDISNKYKDLEKLKFGTQEWREAVSELNDQVLTTKDNYNQLLSSLTDKEKSKLEKQTGMDLDLTADDYYMNTEGVWVMTDQARQKYEAVAAQANYNANQAEIANKAVEARLEEEANAEELLSNESKRVGSPFDTSNMLSTASYDRIISAAKNGREFNLAKLQDENFLKSIGVHEQDIKILLDDEDLRKALYDNAEAVKNNTDSIISDIQSNIASDTSSGAYNLINNEVSSEYQAGLWNETARLLHELTLRKASAIGDDSVSQSDINDYLDSQGMYEKDGKYYSAEDDTELENVTDDFVLQSTKEFIAGKDAEDYLLNSKEGLEEIEKIYKESEKAYNALDKVSKKWKDLGDSPSNAKIEKFIKDNSKAFADMFGIDEEDLDNDKIEEIVSQYKDQLVDYMTTGDDEALEQIREYFTKGLDIDPTEEAADFKKSLEAMLEEQGIEGSALDYLLSDDEIGDFQTRLQRVQTLIDEGKIKPGDIIDDTSPYYNELMNLVDSSKMTVDEMVAVWQGLGFSVDYELAENQSFWAKLKNYFTHEYKVDSKGQLFKISSSLNTENSEIVNREDDTPDPIDTGKDTDTEEEKKIDDNPVIERFHVINKYLDKQENKLSRIEKQQNKTYGTKKLKAFNKELKAINKQLDLQARKVNEANMYTQFDYNKMLATGVTIKKGYLNQDGTFTSSGYDAVMEDLLNNLNKSGKAYKDFKKSLGGDTSDKKLQNELKVLKDQYESDQSLYEQRKEAIEAYEESIESAREAIQNYMDTYDEMLEKQYEKFTYEVEIKTTINENSLNRIQYYIDKYSDGIYKNIEALFGTTTVFTKGVYDEQLGPNSYYYKQLKNAIKKIRLYGNDELVTNSTKYSWVDANDKTKKTSYLTALEEQYKAGLINQANYVEGLQEGYDQTLSNLQNLIDSMEDLHNGFSLGVEEFQSYFETLNGGFEHSSQMLDYMKSLLELTGDSSDNLLKDIYKTQTSTAAQTFSSLKKEYDALKSYYDKIQEDYNTNLANGNIEAAQEAKKILEENEEKLLNSEESMYQSYQDYVQALTDETNYYIQEQMTSLSESFAMVSGGLDEILQRMSLTSTRQDEYLTSTNKIYETNKMLRNLQKDMSAIDNKTAKSKYLAFANEIKQLQNKDELSNLELTIAQKKYDLLKAQIALEESQNAKQTIRLMRDNEGNYGYIYTANQEAVTEAEQALEDAQNALYNTELEAANNYGQKIVQTEKEALDALQTIQENYMNGTYGAYGSPEAIAAYNEARENALNQYGQLLSSYSDMYAIATTDDARVAEDAWIGAYQAQIDMAQTWKDKTLQASNAVTKVMIENTKIIAQSMEEMVNSDILNNINEENKSIADAIIEALDPDGEMSQLMDAVVQTTEKYLEQKQALDELVKTTEELIETYARLIQQEGEGVGAVTSVNQRRLLTYLNDVYFVPNGQKTSVAAASNGVSYIQGTEGSAWFKNAMSGLEKNVIESNDEKAQAILEYLAQGKHGYMGYNKNGGLIYKLVNGVEQPTKKQTEAWAKEAGAQWYTSFATGGYTGDWGYDGKLAILHQKELVLNKDDTSNLLLSVELMRDIVKDIDLKSLQNQIANISSINGNINTSNNETLDQNVHITAEFPSVTNRTEIEQAFENLANKAAQYAYRKR